MHNFLKWSFVLLLAGSVLLTGCGSTVPVIKPFKMDIQQGNIVTSKMLLQLRPGMTKSQVRFVMGTPLIVDSFHSNRWDYFYQMRQAGKIVEQRRVILEFEKDALLRVRGDVVPQGTAGAAIGTETGAVALPKSIEPQPKEKGFMEKLKFWKKDEKKPEIKPEIKPEVKPENRPEIKSEPQEVAPAAAMPETPADGAASGSGQEAPSQEAPDESTPSILSVPIELGPSIEQTPPVEQSPPTAAPIESPPPVEQPVPVEQAPAPKMPEAEPPKAAPIEPEPVLVAPEKPAPAQPTPKDEPFIFRMDKDLDTKNIEAVPIEAAPAAKPKKTDTPPPEPEAEPGYFEKMLEKIGF